MPMTHRLILSPSEATKNMLLRRMFLREEDKRPVSWGAVLLVQGSVPELFYAVDMGSKFASVAVREIVGNCPQHINTAAFIGPVADVKQVLEALKSEGVLV